MTVEAIPDAEVYGHSITEDIDDVEVSATTIAANLSTLCDIYEIPGLATLRDQAWAVAYGLRGMYVSLDDTDVCSDCKVKEHAHDG